MRLIDADALIQEIDAQCPDYKSNGIGCIVKGALNDCIKIIKRQPTIEAVPMVHGMWIRHENNFLKEYICECSMCHAKDYWYEVDRFNEYYWFHRNFCPNCGARMDGKAVGE